MGLQIWDPPWKGLQLSYLISQWLCFRKCIREKPTALIDQCSLAASAGSPSSDSPIPSDAQSSSKWSLVTSPTGRFLGIAAVAIATVAC